MRPIRDTIAATVLLCLAWTGAAIADELYQAQTIVTGQREETRAPGVRQCFVDVLVKVSGDPRLIGDPRVAAMSQGADTFVRAIRYHDRFAGKPIHDEQGTRDRPHDLTVDFDAAKIDEALHSLGLKPWTAQRPRLAMFVAMQQGASSDVLTQDEERGFAPRAALAAASQRIGLPVVLPSRSSAASSGVDVAAVRSASPEKLDRIAKEVGGDLALVGTMAFDEAELGWVADWRIASNGTVTAWRIRGVNFDEAFRNGLRGAAQVLSGNGRPD